MTINDYPEATAVALDEVDKAFTYHKPTADQIPKYEAIRDKAKQLAHVIVLNVPASADRAAAIRKLREAVMTANAGIAING